MAKRIKIPKMYMDAELVKQYEEERIEKIYQEVKLRSRVRKVNRMLKTLKDVDYYEDSVAVENIFNYLGTEKVNVNKTKGGYISLKATTNVNMTQVTGINKAINEFLKNKTSTPTGMRELFEERRSLLKSMMNDTDFVDKLSYKDLRSIYKVFKSNEYTKNERRYDSKSFFVLYTKAIDEKWSRQKFIKNMDMYIDIGSDEDLKADIKKIYDDYIKNYAKRS